MEEQQIINDILDKLYGNENQSEVNSEIKKRIKKEKEEKYDEIVKQINFICKSVEKELKAILGDNISELQKGIRKQVFKSIQAEVENGNNILDSNGKIRTGKIFDLVMQSREEVLDKTTEESKNTHKNGDITDNTTERDNKNPSTYATIIDKLEGMGLELSEDDIDVIDEAMRCVDEVLKRVEENKKRGMKDEDAWENATEGMSPEEVARFLGYIDVAGRVKILDTINNINETNKFPEGKEGEEVVATDSITNDISDPPKGENSNIPSVSEETTRTQSGINDVEALLTGKKVLFKKVKNLNGVDMDRVFAPPTLIDTLDKGVLKMFAQGKVQHMSNEEIQDFVNQFGTGNQSVNNVPLSVEDREPTEAKESRTTPFNNDVSIEVLNMVHKTVYRFYTEDPTKSSSMFRENKERFGTYKAPTEPPIIYPKYTRSIDYKKDKIGKIVHGKSVYLQDGAIPEEVVDGLMEENGTEINAPNNEVVEKPVNAPKEPELSTGTISIDSNPLNLPPNSVEKLLFSQRKIIDLVARAGRMDDIKKSTELIAEEAKMDKTVPSTGKGDEENKGDSTPGTTDEAKEIDE